MWVKKIWCCLQMSTVKIKCLLMSTGKKISLTTDIEIERIHVLICQEYLPLNVDIDRDIMV